ncbi:MAG: 50S ribosomal protein L10 [Planctomycetota bacterium]|nr:50S ribosomal protein L10 [Planctomycetota bacterium]
MPSELKKLMVEEIDLRIGSVSSLVLVGMTGITANQNNELRSQAAEKEIGVFNVKNSLAKLVFSKHGREDLSEYLEGPTVAIYGDERRSRSRSLQKNSPAARR